MCKCGPAFAISSKWALTPYRVRKTMNKQQIELQVRGMTCVSCAHHVTHALESVAGVEKVIVPGWQSARATVIADDGVSTTALIDAVTAVGYTAAFQKQGTRQNSYQDTGRHDSDIDFLGCRGC